MKLSVLVTTLFCYRLATGEPQNLLKNGQLEQVGKRVTAWTIDDEPKQTDRENAPEDAKNSLRVDIATESNQHGYIYQVVNLSKTTKSAAYILSGKLKSSADGLAFFQVKLFSGKERRGIFNVGSSKAQWQQVSKAFAVDGDVDGIQVLCRYYRRADCVGKKIWFSDVRLAISEDPVVSESKPITDDSKKTVWILVLGDSTVASYHEAADLRGWGQVIGHYFQEHVGVKNLAKSGRSSKSFITEGLLEKALKERAHYVIIQFGHNDSHNKTEPKATDANTDFKEYLRTYLDSFRKVNVEPILVTPMHRRTFGKDGSLSDNLLPYATAMKEVALEKNAPLIDLHKMSGALFLKLGDAVSTDLSVNAEDRTHFSDKGARAMAELVLKGLAGIQSPLAKEIKPLAPAE
ncbi:MAG: rhamnogalacturonan acetylesterase [Planctomycetota bacterium]|nr:rhamnogalacturonan acetylesterase [Planctomycetota bacterium]